MLLGSALRSLPARRLDNSLFTAPSQPYQNQHGARLQVLDANDYSNKSSLHIIPPSNSPR